MPHQLGECPGSILRLQVHGAYRILEHDHLESFAQCVACSGAYAVVGRESPDEQSATAPLVQKLREVRVFERRVDLRVGPGSLGNDQAVRRHAQRRRHFRTGGIRDAVRGPRSAELAK